MVNESIAVPEFSRPIPIDQIGSRETVREITATPAECAALAERLDLIALDGLTATLHLRRLPGGLIRVSGRFAAEVVQSCVVTLVPVQASCAAAFSMRFGEIAMPETLREIEVAAEGEDEPEPVEGGQIDLGEAVVQQLAVTLDPYPRAPGATLPETSSDGEEETGAAKVHPFAVLAKLTGEPGDER